MKISMNLPRQVWFAAFGVALLLAFGIVALRSGPLAPIQVTVTQVAKGEIHPALFGIGTVEAQRAYLIGPTAAGRVGRVLVDVGETVKAGQLLAEMDPVDLDKRVTSAFAASDRGRSAVVTAQAQVHDAQSRQALAASEARRYIDLGQKGFVSQSVVDSKLQQQQSADAQLAAAESTLTSARQELARLGAEHEGIIQQRSNIRLVAPTDSIVTSRDVEPGTTIVAGQSVLKLVQPSSLWITVRLDQGRSAGLQVGLPAEIVLRSHPHESFAGKVVRVEPISDSVTEERITKVVFDKLPQDITTGEIAEVTLRLPIVKNVLTVPNASLRYRNAQSGVWLRDDGHLRFAPVKSGAEGLDGKVQIIEGLEEGNEVIVYSERDLMDSSRIKVVPALVGKAK